MLAQLLIHIVTQLLPVVSDFFTNTLRMERNKLEEAKRVEELIQREADAKAKLVQLKEQVDEIVRQEKVCVCYKMPLHHVLSIFLSTCIEACSLSLHFSRLVLKSSHIICWDQCISHLLLKLDTLLCAEKKH